MKRILFLLMLTLWGCATAGSGDVDLSATPQIQTVMSGSVSADGSSGAYSSAIRYTNEPVTVAETVNAPGEEVWPLLLDAYRAEGLEPDGADPQSGILNLSRVEWVRVRNDLPLSNFLDCGPSSTGRPLADDARVVGSIASQIVTEDSGNTQVTLRFEAMAFPFDASSGQVRGCTTKGVLERDIIDRILNNLASGPVIPVSPGTEVRTQPTPTVTPVRADPTNLPIENGDQVRVWISPSVRLSGSYMGVRQDSLLLLRSRRTALPLWSIEEIQVKRTNRSSTIIGSLVGVVAGVTLALTTDLGIGGRHSVQGDILNPGLGALAGGLAGAAVGSIFLGTSWVEIPLGTVKPKPKLD